MNMAYDLSADELVFADLSNLSREYCTYRIKGEEALVGLFWCFQIVFKP